jgi:hypothetical protein
MLGADVLRAVVIVVAKSQGDPGAISSPHFAQRTPPVATIEASWRLSFLCGAP